MQYVVTELQNSISFRKNKRSNRRLTFLVPQSSSKHVLNLFVSGNAFWPTKRQGKEMYNFQQDFHFVMCNFKNISLEEARRIVVGVRRSIREKRSLGPIF